MRRIRARKQRRLRQPLRLHQHIDHAARILHLDERSHRQVELALGPSGFGHVAQECLVLLSRGDQKERVDIVGMLEALLGEGDIPVGEGLVPDRAPPHFGARCGAVARNIKSHIELAELDGQVKAVVGVGGHAQGQVRHGLRLQELGDLAALRTGHLRQERLCMRHVTL